MKLKLLLFASLFLTVGVFAQKQDLEVRKDEIREENGRLLFEPDRRVMRSKYNTFIFNKKEFTSKVGTLEDAPDNFTLEVTVKPTSVKTYKPKKGAAPEGGIKTNYFDAKIHKLKS